MHIPPELRLAVLGAFGDSKDQTSIAACCRLDRSWYLLATPILYRQPDFVSIRTWLLFLHGLCPAATGQHPAATVNLPTETEATSHLNPETTDQKSELTSTSIPPSLTVASHSLSISGSSSTSKSAFAPPTKSTDHITERHAHELNKPQLSCHPYHSPSLNSHHIPSTGFLPGLYVNTIDLSMLSHRWTEIDSASIKTLVQTCPNIRHLNLADCEQLRDEAIQAIAENLGPNQLQSLVISRCKKITDLAILSICTHMTRLQILELSGCDRITDISVIELGHAGQEVCKEQGNMLISETLQSLDLSHCTRITETGIRALRVGAVNLKSLNMEGCYGIVEMDTDDELLQDEWTDDDGDEGAGDGEGDEDGEGEVTYTAEV